MVVIFYIVTGDRLCGLCCILGHMSTGTIERNAIDSERSRKCKDDTNDNPQYGRALPELAFSHSPQFGVKFVA